MCVFILFLIFTVFSGTKAPIKVLDERFCCSQPQDLSFVIRQRHLVVLLLFEVVYKQVAVSVCIIFYCLPYLNRLKILENELLLQLKHSFKNSTKNSIYLR